MKLFGKRLMLLTEKEAKVIEQYREDNDYIYCFRK